MKWRKLGLINTRFERETWSFSHSIVPVPFLLNVDVIRIFVTCLDRQGRGRPGYFDVSAANPKKIISYSKQPVLNIGNPGCFDDNGVMAVSLVRVNPDKLYMYYVGFELCTNIRYRIFTGLAISHDGGESFFRHSQTPILDRSDKELYFRCGPFVMYEEGKFRLWYVAGSEWTTVNDKTLPVYSLYYQESENGIDWADAGRLCIAPADEDEHGFGRPWVVKRNTDNYQLYYSIRRKSLPAYRLGYAESSDGITWVRKDSELGLDVSPAGFDSDAIMYSAVITAKDKTYCFYNGNNFGEQGVGVAELIR